MAHYNGSLHASLQWPLKSRAWKINFVMNSILEKLDSWSGLINGYIYTLLMSVCQHASQCRTSILIWEPHASSLLSSLSGFPLLSSDSSLLKWAILKHTHTPVYEMKVLFKLNAYKKALALLPPLPPCHCSAIFFVWQFLMLLFSEELWQWAGSPKQGPR